MKPSVATPYDRNPARLALIVRTSKKNKTSDGTALLGVLATIAVVCVCIWNFLPA